MAPWDMIVDAGEAKRLALFFDRILVWPLFRQERAPEENARINAELEFLATKRVVARVGVQLPIRIQLGGFDSTEMMQRGFDTLIPPFAAMPTKPEHISGATHADRMVRFIASNLATQDGAPVTAHLSPHNLPAANEAHTVQLTLKHIPMPPEDMPWEDLIQFRDDAETKALLSKLRIWLQRQVREGINAHVIEEELVSMLDDYRKYMKLQNRKYGEGVLSTVLVVASDAMVDLLNFQLGDALKSLLDIRARKIELTEAELQAPGREVSYLAKAQTFIEQESR